MSTEMIIRPIGPAHTLTLEITDGHWDAVASLMGHMLQDGHVKAWCLRKTPVTVDREP